MLQGLDSLTYLLTQRVPCGTPHSGSGAPRTGSLNFKCLGVLVVFDSDELARILDAVEWQRRREQNSLDYALSESSPHLTGLHPSLLVAKDISCARASPTQVLDVLCSPPPLGCRMQLSHVCCSRSL